jgi:hypothetical protein
MTNEEIVRHIMYLDKKAKIKREELSLLNRSIYILKKQIKAENIEVEEFKIKKLTNEKKYDSI